MKSALILLAVFFAVCACAPAQCPEFLLADLQNLQRASPDQKQNTILDLGFDLRSEFTNQAGAFRNYSKCWNSNLKDKPIFEQLIWWNLTENTVTFMTLKEAHFNALRKAIVERQTSGTITENPDFYIGKMFHYRFGNRRVDGADYFYVSIRFR